MSHPAEKSHSSSYVVLGDRGRLVLPAAVRRKLKLEQGSRLQVYVDNDGTLVLRPYAAIVDGLRGSLAHLKKPGESVVDELIAERRQEARREEQGS